MPVKIFAAIIFLLFLAIEVCLGFSIAKDFMVLYHQQWGDAVIERVKEKRKPFFGKRKTSQYGNKTYKIRFLDHAKMVKIVESIDFKVGDSIRVVHSPGFPKNFKVKVPNTLWISAWIGAFVILGPLILYFSGKFLMGYLKGDFL